MRILVTGGAGFVGCHLCARLLAEDHEVVAVDDLSLGRRDNLTEALADRRFRLDVTSVLGERFDAIVAGGRFEAVFHLAANSDILAGSEDRQIDLDRTFLTTYAVCEAAARHGIRQLVFASSSAVCGDAAEPIREDHGPLLPESFYGAAKLAAEAYCSAYAHRHGIRTWIFRFPNVVGPRSTHGVIHDFVAKLRRDPTRLEVLGDGSQRKPYLWVGDLLDAIFIGWQRGAADPVSLWNIADDSSTTVRRIAEIVIDEMGLVDAVDVRYGAEPRGWPGDVPRFAYDTSRIRALGWRPRLSSDEAVREAARALARAAVSV